MKTETRKNKMLEMKKLGKTNVEIGNCFGISYERVRQIIGNFGHFKSERIKRICPFCKKSFECLSSSKKKYYKREYAYIAQRLIASKCIPEYTKEETIALNKVRNDKRKEKRRLYYQRPEVKQRRKEYQKTEIYKKYQREYSKKRT